jgi:hypothetical protein
MLVEILKVIAVACGVAALCVAGGAVLDFIDKELS